MALAKRGILTLRWPVHGGIVENWDDWEKVLHNAFYNELRMAPEEHPVVLLTPPHAPRAQREKAVQTLFETFAVPALFLMPSPVACVFATAQDTTGLSVEIGADMALVSPVVNGKCVPGATRHNGVAGKALTDYLTQLLSRRGYHLTSSSETEFVNALKSACFVSEDFEGDSHLCAESPQSYTATYEMADGTAVTLDKERFQCPELLFTPIAGSLSEPGLIDLITESLTPQNGLSATAAAQCYANIVLSGGSSMIPGLAQRVEDEVAKRAPAGTRICVVAPENRRHLDSIGAALIASMPSFSQLYISKEHYDEQGPNAANVFCTW